MWCPRGIVGSVRCSSCVIQRALRATHSCCGGGSGANSATPRAWTDDWRAWLVAAGWLEDVALDSAEYQARGAWDALLAEFACLGVVTQKLGRGAAVAMLRALLQDLRDAPGAPAASRLLVFGHPARNSMRMAMRRAGKDARTTRGRQDGGAPRFRQLGDKVLWLM